MKLPILLALFAVTAYAQSPSERETQYAAYSEYIYEYKGQILSGLPGVSKEFAGLKIRADAKLQIHSQNRFMMQLRNIQLCKIQRQVEVPTEQQEVQPAECQEDSIITQIKQELEKQIEFYWTRGHVSQISTRISDPDWSVNIKRGVLELLQVNLEGNPNSKNLPKSSIQQEFYTVMEQGIAGECETIYNVRVHVSKPIAANNEIIPERDGLNVTKVFNYENCNNRPIRYHTAILKGVVCEDCQTKDEQKLLTQVGQVRYDITGNRKLFVIDAAVAEGKHVFEPFGQENGQAITFVNQHLIKVEARKIPAPDDPEFIPALDANDRKDQTEGIRFVFPAEKPREVIQKETHSVDCEPMSTEHGLHGQIEQLLNNIVNGITEYVNEESLTQLQLLTEKLRGLNRTELCHCMNHFGQDLVNDAELNEKRRMILEDLLSRLGSLHAVEVLYRRIESRRIVGYRAAELMSGLSFHPNPDDQIVDTVLELCMSNAVDEEVQLKQTCWLTFGSLVHAVCHDGNRQRCPQTKEDRYMRALIAGTGHGQPEAERRMCFKAIGNAGIHFQNTTFNLLESIQKIVRDEKDTRPEIKAQAIYALRRMSTKIPEEIRTILTPVFRNRAAHHEVRIAAFVVMMDTQPDHLTIQMLAQVLQRETNRHVGNFVYSYLKGMADSKIPCKKHISSGAREALKIAKKFAQGLQYSKSFHWTNEILKNRIGHNINLNWISSPESSYGIGGSTKFSAKMFGYNMNWLEWGYHSEHMEELAQELVSKVKGVYPPISKKFSEETNQQQILTSREILMGVQSSDLKDLVKRIDTEVNVTERHPNSEPMSASFFVKSFGNELRYLTLDKATIEEILSGQSTALRDLEVELSANKPQIKYQKAFTFGEGWQMWPTTVGIPLHLSLTNPAIVAIHATGKMEMKPPLQQVLQNFDVKAKKIDISGVFNPRLGMMAVGRLGVSLNHMIKAGVAYEGVYNTSAFIDGSINIDIEKMKFESKFKAPQNDHTVVTLKGKPFTFSLKGEAMPKQYAPAQSGSMLHMMMMTPEQIQNAANEESRVEVAAKTPIQTDINIGEKTLIAQVHSMITPATACIFRPTRCLIAGPANVGVILRPGQNLPAEFQMAGKIADWVVTPEQYEEHIRRTSIRQHIEPKGMDSSESGSRSFTSAQRFQDVVMPGAFRNSKQLELPTAKPVSLEERRSKEKFDFDTAYWTKEDRRIVPLTSINSIQDSQQQQQQPQCAADAQFVPIKQIFFNITGKGAVPQTEVLTAMTVDTRDRYYKAYTFDLISQTQMTPAEQLIEGAEHQEMERLRNDPLNPVSQERLAVLEQIDEERQAQISQDRVVACVQAEAAIPDVKFKAQTAQDVLPAPVADDTMVKYKVGIQYGKTCESDRKMNIKARVEKSEQQLMDEKRAAQGEFTAEERQCEADRQGGNTYSLACKQVVEARTALRALHAEVTAKVDPVTRMASRMVCDAAVRFMGKVASVKRESAINEQDKVLISVDQDRSRESFTVSAKAPLANVKVKARDMVKLPALYNPMKPLSHAVVEMFVAPAKPRCKINTLDKVITFDDITYDYELSKCFHILAKDCSPTERFLVLARKRAEGQPQKDTIIHLAGHKIEFRPDDVDGIHVFIDDVNQQMVAYDKIIMREDGTMEKKNVNACKRRTLMDVITPDIEVDGITSSEVYRILMHKERHRTPPPAGQPTPRHFSHSASHGASASHSQESLSISLQSTSSEEVKMSQNERGVWKMLDELMKMRIEGLDQREIMRQLNIEDQLMLSDGSEVVPEQVASRPLIRIFRTARSVTLYDYRLGLYVATCGKNIKVEIARHFQDMVCGACGHFNGEVTEEFQGPSMEIYRDPKQFALAYQLQSVPQECAQECVPRVNIHKQDRQVDNVDSSCYSKVLVPRCQTPCRVAETKQVMTEFVCISRDSGLKAQLDDSIARQRPHEVVRTLSNKSPSFVEAIDIHTRCQQ